jgi:hypothetical protein
LNSAGSELHECDGMASSSRSQVIYGDLAEIPRTSIESEDITQQCVDQSCVAQPQPQYGTEEVDLRQTTELCCNNSDANRQHLPTASATNYGEDRDEHTLTAFWQKGCVNKVMTRRKSRQQRKSPSQFAPRRVSPIILLYIASPNQPLSTTKSPRVSTGSKCTRTAYSSSQLYEMKQELRKDSDLYRPHRISLAEPPNLSERQVRTWFRNWKKRKKKTLSGKRITGTAKSKVTSVSH